MKKIILILAAIMLVGLVFGDVEETKSANGYTWSVDVMISLDGGGYPSGGDDLYYFSTSPDDPSSWCGYAQSGLMYAIWTSDISAEDQSDVFLPGDDSYGFAYYGDLFGISMGYLNFNMSNFKDEARGPADKSYDDGDTLHIRLYHNDGSNVWVWGLDQVFTTADLVDGAIQINAVMELAPHVVWNQLYFHCFPGAIEENPTSAPTEYEIAQNSPNPFNSTTAIDYTIPEHSNVTLDVFDIGGRHIKGLVNENLNSGRYSVKWDGTDESGNTVPSGTYFYKIKAGDYEAERKMLLVK